MVSHRGIHRPNAPPTHSAAFHACGRRAADPRIGGRGVWGTYATGQSTDTALTAHAGNEPLNPATQDPARPRQANAWAGRRHASIDGGPQHYSANGDTHRGPCSHSHPNVGWR